MRLSALAIIAVTTLISFSSCKKDKPSYCEQDYFGEIILTDATGAAATSFGMGSTMNIDLLFINGSSDTIELTYSSPWITFELYQGAQMIAASNDPSTGSSVSGMSIAPADTVSAFYPWSSLQPITGTLAPGTYTFKAKNTYQYKGCDAGITGVEKTLDFTITQ